MLSVKLTYPDELKKSINIVNRADLACHIYNEAKKHIADNHLSDLSFESLIEIICHIYAGCNYYSSSYLKYCLKELTHEMAVKMYFDITCTEPPLHAHKEKNSVLALQKYKSEGLTTADTDKSEQKYSKTKTKILSEYRSKKPFDTNDLCYSAKYKRYYELLIPTLLMSTKSHSHMSDLERFIYVQQQPFCYYAIKKIDSGKTLDNLLDILYAHQNIEKHFDDPVENERSAFLLEQMYHGTTYIKFFMSYLNNNANVDKDYNEHLMLLLSRLYDSSYISLVEYIEAKYSYDFKSYFDIEEGEDVRFDTYTEFQMHNEIILPILYHVATVVFNELYDNNMHNIKIALGECIKRNNSKSFTYRHKFNSTLKELSDFKNMLTKTVEELSTETTPNQNQKELLKGAESKLFVLNAKVKLDNKNYKVSHALFKSFFLTDNFDFLSSLRIPSNQLCNMRTFVSDSFWHFYREKTYRASRKKINDYIYI